ncbi:HNH/ENDO VII family nuclease [Bartonella senegalensis]|uniref:HNH/ENDO VII family nuclease n=1 Tax=Bartonella senegalensis TaxID=1468418 RepID=UPI0002F8FC83|nr:HNH/ENDO VII family nuclease [Bartonella senegalensis]
MKWIKKKNMGTAEPVEFKGTKVYQDDELFEPETVSSWKEKGQIITGTNLERMETGRAPIGVDCRPIMLYPMTQEGPLAEVLYSFYQGRSLVSPMQPKRNFISKVICWISNKIPKLEKKIK